MKNKFGFILIKPQLGENIGACARSMKNFGFQNLNIVSPKFAFPNHKTKVTAVGAYDIINKTKVFNSTEKAVSEFDLVFSLSARRRDINKNHITINDATPASVNKHMLVFFQTKLHELRERYRRGQLESTKWLIVVLGAKCQLDSLR